MKSGIHDSAQLHIWPLFWRFGLILLCPGTLDNSLASLEGLTSLDLSDNKFEGTLPDGLGSSPNLARVSLEGNYLIGVIPGSLATSKAMSFLELGDNNLEGFAEEWYSGSMKNSDYIIIHLEHNSLEVSCQSPEPKLVEVLYSVLLRVRALCEAIKV